MWTLFIALTASAFLTLGLGHLIHWAMHQRWAGKLYRMHLDHHRRYSVGRFMTSAYESSASFVSFIIAYAVILLIMCMLMIFNVLSLLSSFVISITVGIVAIITELAHTAFHLVDDRLPKRLRNSIIFKNFRKLHMIHHRNTKMNFGILNFAWDRIMRTFTAKNDS